MKLSSPSLILLVLILSFFTLTLAYGSYCYQQLTPGTQGPHYMAPNYLSSLLPSFLGVT